MSDHTTGKEPRERDLAVLPCESLVLCQPAPELVVAVPGLPPLSCSWSLTLPLAGFPGR